MTKRVWVKEREERGGLILGGVEGREGGGEGGEVSLGGKNEVEGKPASDRVS